MAPSCAPAEAARRAGGREGKRQKMGGEEGEKNLKQMSAAEASGERHGETRLGGANACSTAAEGQHQPRGKWGGDWGGGGRPRCQSWRGGTLRPPFPPSSRLPERSSRLPSTQPTLHSHLPQPCPCKAAPPDCTEAAHASPVVAPGEPSRAVPGLPLFLVRGKIAEGRLRTWSLYARGCRDWRTKDWQNPHPPGLAPSFSLRPSEHKISGDSPDLPF